LGSKRKDWQYPSAEWVANVERLVMLEAKLPEFLTGKSIAADSRDWQALFEVCGNQQRYVEAAKIFANAFTADAKLANDMVAHHRYHAVFAAALAAAGKGKDADKIDDIERGRLRRQAIEWLRADLAHWTKQASSDKSSDRELVLKTLRDWQRHTYLAGIRDKDVLAKLPADEREACQKLWADVAEVLTKSSEAK